MCKLLPVKLCNPPCRIFPNYVKSNISTLDFHSVLGLTGGQRSGDVSAYLRRGSRGCSHSERCIAGESMAWIAISARKTFLVPTHEAGTLSTVIQVIGMARPSFEPSLQASVTRAQPTVALGRFRFLKHFLESNATHELQKSLRR